MDKIEKVKKEKGITPAVINGGRIATKKEDHKKNDREIKKRKFIKYYLSSGNAIKSYKRAFGVTESSALAYANKYLNSLDFSFLLEQAGLTDKDLITSLKEGLKATKPYGKDNLVYPDYSTRHDYLNTSLKLKKRLQDNRTGSDNTILTGLSIVIDSK